MKRLAKGFLAVALIGLGLFFWLTRPDDISEIEVRFASLSGTDAVNGEKVFWASGCASCHAKKGAKGDGLLQLGGGHELNTPFGTFVTPNISPDVETGIGAWSLNEFAVSLLKGQSPQGRHYYPSFPYASYARMDAQDIADLFEYLKTLPPVSQKNRAHDLALPLRWRRPLGVWKKLFVRPDWIVDVDQDNAKLVRGRYLVEGLGHCGECHTPRNLLGGLKISRWLAGGPAPEGKGRVPNITSHISALGAWSAQDIAYYLESGFTPEFDSVGGSMAPVQQNLSRLPKEDREAIAAYLKSVPARSVHQ